MNGYLSGQSKPAWYELSLKENSILRISVHRAAFEEMMKFSWGDAPAVAQLSKIFGFSSFVPPGEKSWGFSEVLRLGTSERPEWISWECPLPRMKVVGDKSAESPLGYTIALRSSLYMFATALWLFKGNTAWKEPQLMVIEDISLPVDPDRHMCNGSLSVTLSPEVMLWISKWISAHGNNRHIPEVVEAMKAASERIWEGSSGHGRFGALCRKPKWLNLDVPGNACGLDPGDYDEESLDRGYSLHPHNVDSSLTRLSF